MGGPLDDPLLDPHRRDRVLRRARLLIRLAGSVRTDRGPKSDPGRAVRPGRDLRGGVPRAHARARGYAALKRDRVEKDVGPGWARDARDPARGRTRGGVAEPPPHGEVGDQPSYPPRPGASHRAERPFDHGTWMADARVSAMATRTSTEPSHEALGLSPDDLRSMYRTMVTARLVDEAAFRLNRQGKAPFVVPISGHEGGQVGTAWPLRRGQDVWLPYYRDAAVVLVAGMTPYEIFLGLFAKAEDPSSGGRQMPSHWGSRRLGIISHSSVIATQIPHAAGIAYAARYRGEDAVVGCWFGEGATSEGAWHEGMNFAGIHQLPVIFVCENNHYAISVAQSKQMAIDNVADRAAEIR